MSEQFSQLIESVRQCRICAQSLPLGPRPVLQAHPQAKILIAGQSLLDFCYGNDQKHTGPHDDHVALCNFFELQYECEGDQYQARERVEY